MLRNNVLRHQLLLMRLVRTQAKATGKYLAQAESLVIKAIKTGKYKSLYVDLIEVLGKMPDEALKLIKDLALYEAEWMARHLNTSRKPVKLPDHTVLETVKKAKVSTSIKKKPETIVATYKIFAERKSKQLVQIVKDAQVLKEEPEQTETKVKDTVGGLFTAQNLALAGLAVLGIANTVRAQVAEENKLLVDWVLDLELNNCPYCEEQADNSPYEPQDVEGLIPAHANCGCILVPVEN